MFSAVSNGWGEAGAFFAGTDDSLRTFALAANNTKSALYAENASASGWAGYFSGRVFVNNGLIIDEGSTGAGTQNGLQVRGGLTSMGLDPAARGHHFLLGGAANSDGLEWRFYEAEDWKVWPNDPDCFSMLADTGASGGRTLQLNVGSAACTIGGDNSLYQAYQSTAPVPGSYLFVIRAKVGDLTGTSTVEFGFSSASVDLQHNSRVISAVDFTERNTWQTLAFRFNSPGGTLNPSIKIASRGTADPTGKFYIDWVAVLPDLPANAALGAAESNWFGP